MSNGDPSVSVIIVTHNSSEVIKRCLDYLIPAMSSVSCEVIVVDNCSSDGTLTLVKRQLPRATLLLNIDNVGFGRACNQAAVVARGSHLLFLNPDVTLDSDAIVSLLEACHESESVGLASGRLRFPDGQFQGTCRIFPTPKNLFFSRGSFLARMPLAPKKTARQGYTRPDYDETTIVPAVSATMVMIRKQLFERVGRFDERFFLFMEDTDISLRIERMGLVNLFVPEAGGVHDWGRGSKAGKLRRSFLHHKAVWQYMRKHFSSGIFVWFLPIMLLLNLIVTALLPDRRGRNRR